MSEKNTYQHTVEVVTRDHDRTTQKIYVGDHELLIWTDCAAALTVNLFTEGLQTHCGGIHESIFWKEAGFTREFACKDGTKLEIETKEFGEGSESGKEWATLAVILITVTFPVTEASPSVSPVTPELELELVP